MTKAFREAVDTGRAILKDKWQDANVSASRTQGITEVRCPGCGVVIKKLAEVGAQQITRVKNQTFISTQMQLISLANYREVALEMTDGTRHVTNACDRCVEEMTDPMVATGIYAANLSEFSDKGSRLSDAMCNRGPVRVLEVGLIVE